MARAPVTCSAMPRAINIMPSVAMNGGSRSRVTAMPLAKPHAVPARMPASMPSQTGKPPAFTARAAVTPASARTDPTDRSMPPVMMTQVAPMPRMAIEVTWSATVSPLPTVRNAPLVSENTATRMTRPPKAANFWTRSFCFSVMPRLRAPCLVQRGRVRRARVRRRSA